MVLHFAALPGATWSVLPNESIAGVIAAPASGLAGSAPGEGLREFVPTTVKLVAEWSAGMIELLGVLIITLLSFYALGFALYRLVRGVDGHTVFREMRMRLVGGILIGLELLVAADIIHTVAVELTYASIGVLTIIVLIRTFLSFTLELELTGRWPWQKRPSDLPEP